MTKLNFVIRTALMNMRGNKLIFVSKFFSSLFCIFFALFLTGSYCGGAVAFVRERCNFADIDSLKMYVAEDINELPKNPEKTEHFIFYAKNNRVTFNYRYLGGSGLALTDMQFDNLFENFCSVGEYISDVKNECVIGNALAKRYKIRVSDVITVGARNYTVRGITDNAGYLNTILLCDPRELEVGCPQICISSEIIYGNGSLYEGERIRNYFASMTNFSDIIPIAAVCAAMLFFSVINVLNIVVINAKKSALRVRIHRSLGASRKMAFLIRFAENLMINLSALAAAAMLIAASQNTVLILFSTTLEFPLTGGVSVFILTVLLSLVYSFGTPKREDICSV